MKWFHNDKVSLGWAVAIEVVVHALFAAQAFLVGDFLGEIALASVFGQHLAGVIGAGLFALFIFGAAFQAFVLGEYMREHVEAFENTAKGNGSYMANWHMIKWLVGGIEISSLLFRCYTIVAKEGNWIQAIIVGILGIVALIYAFAQAKVIHASVNRPVEYDVNLARNQAGKAIVTEALDLIPQMSAEQKRRFYTGDLSAVDEVYQGELSRQQEKLQAKEDREALKRNQKAAQQQQKAARELEKQERAEERRERDRQRKEGQQRDYATGQNYTQKLLGGSNDENHPPFLKAVQNNQGQQDGQQRRA